MPFPGSQILQIAKRCEETATRLILDECFCDLLDHPEAYSVVPEAEHFPGLFILRAFTKTYAMAGLRLGYGICADRGLLRRLSAGRQPWSISVPAQEAGCAALRESVYLNEARELLKAGRVYLTRELRRMGFLVYDSDINFILFFYGQEPRPLYLYEACLQRGILLPGLQQFYGTCLWILPDLRERTEGKPDPGPYHGADSGGNRKIIKGEGRS